METMIFVLVIGLVLAAWVAFVRIEALKTRVAALDRKVEILLNRQTDFDNEGKSAREFDTGKTVEVAASKTEQAPQSPLVSVVTPNPIISPAAQAATRTPSLRAPKPKAAPKPTLKPKPKLDLETLLGAKGSVWIGGLALLFGAVFLLRYTIEAGLLTPMMRISVAVVMGVVALGLSEAMARRDLKSPIGKALTAKADIPAILAAVGVFTLFGAVYAAHALYGLLGTLPAFGWLAVIAVGGMVLSLRRGPWLAAIGLVGALATPLLIASVTPSFIGVLVYVAIITAAALWVAQRQGWSWLRAAALVGATFWLTMLLGKAVGGAQFGLWTASLMAVTALTIRDIIRAPTSVLRLKYAQEWRYLAWTGVAVLTALAVYAGDGFAPISYALPFVYLIGYCVAVWRGDADRLWPLLVIGGGLFALIGASVWPRNLDMAWPFITAFSALAGVFAMATLSVAHRLTDDRGATALTAVGGALTAALLVTGIDRVSMSSLDLETWAGFTVAAIFAVATLSQTRLAVVRGAIWIAAILWALAAVSLGDLPVTAGLFSVGLAGLIGLAVFSQPGRDDLWVRLAPMLLAGVAGLAANEAVSGGFGEYISTTPVLNALWLYFGLPGALAAVGAGLLRRRHKDLAAQALLGGAVVFGLLLTVLLIHHAMNGGDLRASPGFEDYAVQLLVAFSVLFGASWMRGGITDWPKAGAAPAQFIVPSLAIGASMMSVFVFVLAQLLGFNPLISAQTVIAGHPVFNALALGFLAPAVLLGASALRFSGHRPAAFVRLLGGLSGVSWLMWTTAQIRRIAHGEVIALDAVSWGNGELYAVSAVWLLTGIALLLAGLKTGRRDLRLASAGLITLTTLKVFLVDMAALDGAFRAVSFIGLGIVLIGIGRLYQTLLAEPQSGSEDTVEEASP